MTETEFFEARQTINRLLIDHLINAVLTRLETAITTAIEQTARESVLSREQVVAAVVDSMIDETHQPIDGTSPCLADNDQALAEIQAGLLVGAELEVPQVEEKEVV